jgi:hypothetical protein
VPTRILTRNVVVVVLLWFVGAISISFSFVDFVIIVVVVFAILLLFLKK